MIETGDFYTISYALVAILFARLAYNRLLRNSGEFLISGA